MENKPRLSFQGLKVLQFMLSTKEPVYGLLLSQKLKIGSGTLYPLLTRLETALWLDSFEEVIDNKKERRPNRKYYKLTTKGKALAIEAINELTGGLNA